MNAAQAQLAFIRMAKAEEGDTKASEEAQEAQKMFRAALAAAENDDWWKVVAILNGDEQY